MSDNLKVFLTGILALILVPIFVDLFYSIFGEWSIPVGLLILGFIIFIGAIFAPYQYD